MTSNSSGVASYSLRRCVSAPAANQMIQRRTNSVRPVGRVSQADSLAEHIAQSGGGCAPQGSRLSL